MFKFKLYHFSFRKVTVFPILRHSNIYKHGNFRYVCFSYNHEYLIKLVKSDNVKKLLCKLQSGSRLPAIDNSVDNSEVVKCLSERKEIMDNLSSLLELEKGRNLDDVELKIMLNAEIKDMEDKLLKIECQLLDAITPKLPNSNEVILEINAGIGGQEAMFFANSLYEMYCGYINYKRWSLNAADLGYSELGGLRHASLFIEGNGALTYLRQESGVHRVQRVPTTERSGRMHTSTVSVAVLPQPKEIDVNLNSKDLIIETKRASGAGGQHVNKTESAVRITHVPTGMSVECQTARSQIKNKEIAFQKLYAKLYKIQQKEQSLFTNLSRKLQMGTNSRSDKVRTYNFPQDRITDHRILRSIHNIPVFLEGKEVLDSVVLDLILESEKNRYNEFIANLKEINIT